MKFHGTIEDILGSKIKVGILRFLFRTRGLFSGREISRQVGFSPTHTISALRELEAIGLVSRQRAGNTDLYQINEKNAAVDGMLAPVFEWESNLPEKLANLYADKLGKELVSIRLFGSAARGEEEPDSDIDLLITLEDRVDIDKLKEVITDIDLIAGQVFGSSVSTIVVKESEFAKKVKAKRGFWKSIPKESKVIFERTR
jgi:predicted nucleotidyltransferase